MGFEPAYIPAIIGAVGAIAGGVMSYSAAQQAAQSQRSAASNLASAQEKSLNVQMAQTNEQAAQERRKQIREARIQRAQIENIAGATGQQSSSAALSGAAGIQAGAATNIGNINTAQSLAGAQTEASKGVVQAQSVIPEKSPWGGVGNSLMNWGLGQAGSGLGKLFEK